MSPADGDERFSSAISLMPSRRFIASANGIAGGASLAISTNECNGTLAIATSTFLFLASTMRCKMFMAFTTFLAELWRVV
jgi:hypothetical protein